MPAVSVLYPRGVLSDVDRGVFKAVLMDSAARHMDAIDPLSGKVTNYADEPNKFIDLTLVAVDPDDFAATALFLVTIVTYGWPDRMRTIKARLNHIAVALRDVIPESIVPSGMDALNITFLVKESGCWVSI